jgi:hypothetical protein
MDDPTTIDRVVARIKELQPFQEIFVTQASCTISSHCGPNTLGYSSLPSPVQKQPTKQGATKQTASDRRLFLNNRFDVFYTLTR